MIYNILMSRKANESQATARLCGSYKERIMLPHLYIGYRYAQPMYAPLGAKDAT